MRDERKKLIGKDVVGRKNKDQITRKREKGRTEDVQEKDKMDEEGGKEG